MNFLNQKFLIYLTLAAAPLYLVKLRIFLFPTNLLELLVLLNITIWLWQKYKKNLKKTCQPLPWQIIFSASLIVFGAIASFSTNGATLAGLGILKSWFALPLFFAYIFYATIENDRELKTALLAVYFSISVVSFVAILYKIFHITTYDDRLSGFYLSPNHLAMYLSPGILLGFYLSRSCRKKETSFPLKVFFMVSLAAILLALFYTYSYAAWIAVFLSIIVTSFFYFPQKSFFGFLFFSLVVFSFLFTSQLHSQKFLNLTDFSQRSSLASRIMIWKAAKKMLVENPVLGIGPGNFQTKYLLLQKHFPPYLEWAVPQPHNIFLAFWLQTGILGLLGFVFLLLFILHSLLKKKQPGKTTFRMILFSFFLYTIFHGLIDTPFWKNDLAFLFCSYVGFFMILFKDFQKNQAPTNLSFHPPRQLTKTQNKNAT